MKAENQLKLFHTTQAMILADLREVESTHGLDLGLMPSTVDSPVADSDYLQFAADLRRDAEAMAEHYVLFFCLENDIRDMVTDALEARHGADWWEDAVPDLVKENVRKNFERERDAGYTVRSSEMIDYSTFGELGEIIQKNWEAFADMFNSKRALQRVLASLNLLRGPIAHSSPLAEDEALRLRLALRDWFRLME